MINKKNEEDYIEIVNKIKDEFIKKVCHSGEFSLSSTGGGMMGDVQKIIIGLHVKGAFLIPEVRQILVQQEEEFLSLLNGNRKVRPYLKTYPSGPETFELSIGFDQQNGSYQTPPYIAYAYTARGNIFYGIFDVSKSILDTILTEAYDDAYKIVYGKEKEN